MTQFAEDMAHIASGRDMAKHMRFLWWRQRFRNVRRSWSMPFAEKAAARKVGI